MNSPWIVVGREHSGDEDENVSPVEAFGPFESWSLAWAWVVAAPTFDGRPIAFTEAVRWLLDLFGVPLRNSDLEGKP